MTFKKIAALALTAVCTTTALAACGSGSGTSEAPAGGAKGASSHETLKVGTMPLTVGVPILYAQEQGYFEEAGLNVDLELFATGAPINEAIAAKEIDIAGSGFASVYSLANAGCKWVADVNTTGGVALYARDGSDIAQQSEKDGLIGSADTLRGKQILEPLGTIAQYMVESYAAAYGLTPEDIAGVNMEYASAFQAFTTGEGDLVALNPTYSYQIEAMDGYVKVVTFEDATKVNMCDGIFVRGEVAEDRSEEVQLFVDCVVKAMDALQDEELRFEYTKKVYSDNAINTSDEEIKRELADRQYVGTEYMKQDGYIFGEAWVAIADFLVQAEKITADAAPNVATSLDVSYVSKTTGLEIKAAR